jgi:RNA polymerase sigma factor (sigma-70 family)
MAAVASVLLNTNPLFQAIQAWGLPSSQGTPVAPKPAAPKPVVAKTVPVEIEIAEEPVQSAPEARDWASLVERIRSGEEAAIEELYKVICQGFGKYLLWRLTENGAADRLQEVVLGVLEAIQHDRIQHPQALIAFIQTIVRRRASEEIGERMAARKRLVSFQEAFTVSSRYLTPEEEFRQKERATIVRRLLNGLPERAREIIVRSYMQEQSQEQICSEMNLSATQYRLLKSRAKARLEENLRAHVGRRVSTAPRASNQLVRAA